jgi:hypothetical protein
MAGGTVMKTTLALILALSLVGVAAAAKDRAYQQGTLTAMNAVPCGTQQKRHKKTREMLCQEYTLQTATTEYHVRQKAEKHSEPLPIGSTADFRLEKDAMKLRVPAGSGKELDYVIVSISKR